MYSTASDVIQGSTFSTASSATTTARGSILIGTLGLIGANYDRSTATILSRVVTTLTSTAKAEVSDAELLERFTSCHDDAAFACLVRRHGSLVRGVCRRVLVNAHDAEDAFQATFLVLARKASSLERRAIAGWLHSVAYHVSLRARASAHRRAKHENNVAPPAPRDPMEEITLREAQAILDEELAQMAEKYRAVVVLCCREGLSRDEAAQHLGWIPSLVKSRLEEARELLRTRLTTRGLTVPMMFPLPMLGEAVLPAEVSPHVADLAEEYLRTTVRKLSWIASIVAIVGISAGAFALLPQHPKSTATAEAGIDRAVEEARPAVDQHGDPLPVGAMARFGTVRFRHGHWVYSLSYSPDGKHLASASADQTVRIWDRASGKLLNTVIGHSDQVYFVSYTPDGKRFVSASGSPKDANDGLGLVWDLAKAERVGRLFRSKDPNRFASGLNGFSLSCDGTLFAAGIDQNITIVEVPSGRDRMICTVSEDKASLRSTRFSPDGKKPAAVFEDVGVCLFEVATGKRLWTNTDQRPNFVRYAGEIVFSPDGKSLAIAIDGRHPMRLLDVETGKETCKFENQLAPIAPLCYSKDGKRLFFQFLAWGGGHDLGCGDGERVRIIREGRSHTRLGAFSRWYDVGHGYGSRNSAGRCGDGQGPRHSLRCPLLSE
jgi:RNA polymerase sigma factor (sigma-70 family)